MSQQRPLPARLHRVAPVVLCLLGIAPATPLDVDLAEKAGHLADPGRPAPAGRPRTTITTADRPQATAPARRPHHLLPTHTRAGFARPADDRDWASSPQTVAIPRAPPPPDSVGTGPAGIAHGG